MAVSTDSVAPQTWTMFLPRLRGSGSQSESRGGEVLRAPTRGGASRTTETRTGTTERSRRRGDGRGTWGERWMELSLG
eukprot:213483-Rhodomonas_salina.1